MRKIILLCSAGMSTSILVNKMKESADSQGYEVEISAHSVSEAARVGADADIVLLDAENDIADVFVGGNLIER